MTVTKITKKVGRLNVYQHIYYLNIEVLILVVFKEICINYVKRLFTPTWFIHLIKKHIHKNKNV